MLLGVGHHFLDVLVGQVGATHDDGGLVGDLRDGREVLHRVVGQLLVEHAVVRKRAQRRHEHGLPVRLGAGHVVGGQDAAGAGLVLDDDVQPLLAEFLGQDAAVLVGAAAGRKGHDEAGHLLGKGEGRGEREGTQRQPHDEFSIAHSCLLFWFESNAGFSLGRSSQR
ncbi:hypothetical protein FQZ97_902410 [compost metagenome]